MKKPIPGKAVVRTDAVALPTSTGDGIVNEVSATDALKLNEHQNDDRAGDLAADIATRPVAAVGAVVEPVNPVLASEPVITGDAAGDAAIVVAGAGPEFVQPLAVAIDTLRPDTYGYSAFLDPAADEFSNTPERSATAVEVGAGDAASPAGPVSVLGVDLAKHEDVSVEYVVFDLTRPPTQEERENLLLVMKHFGAGLPQGTDIFAPIKPREMPGSLDFFDRHHSRFADDRSTTPTVNRALSDLYPEDAGAARYIRISAKIPGFRRGGRAHPAEAVEYRLDEFTPAQVEAILTEPQLVAEII
jgi:hypothetical protein